MYIHAIVEAFAIACVSIYSRMFILDILFDAHRIPGDSADIDFHGDVPASGPVLGEADHHQAQRLQRLGHL